MSQGRILLIDDEPEIVEQYSRALRNEGYEVDIALSGEEGWEKYQARYYDAVIADWRMPDMDGLELLHKIDQMHAFAKVIIVAGFGDKEFERIVTSAYAFGYLEKPIDIDDMLRKVEEAIERRDGVIAALEEWVETHPEESSRPIKATLPEAQRGHFWSAKDILEEIKSNTERGRQEYRNLIQLTIDLLTRGKIQ
jgi:DNA-binding NtrC family response regulator